MACDGQEAFVHEEEVPHLWVLAVVDRHAWAYRGRQVAWVLHDVHKEAQDGVEAAVGVDRDCGEQAKVPGFVKEVPKNRN